MKYYTKFECLFVLIIYLRERIGSVRAENLSRTFDIIYGKKWYSTNHSETTTLEDTAFACLHIANCSIIIFDKTYGTYVKEDVSQWNYSRNHNFQPGDLVLLSTETFSQHPDHIVISEFSSLAIVSKDVTKFDSATDICKEQLGPYAHLIWLDTREKANLIYHLLEGIENYPANYLIGLTDRAIEGTFEWIDEFNVQVPIDFTDWLQWEPNNDWGNENCVIYQESHKGWNDVPCNLPYNYICELQLPTE